MILRIDSQLKAKANDLAKAEGKSVSRVVRELLEEYVRDRDISAYVDDLWKRIGDKVTSKGFGPKGIDRVIAQVRR
jgi:antitoxin component of RelBE/YafQ-DinJ toxin-antitoxin module